MMPAKLNEIQLSSEEISFLQQKKSMSILFLLIELIAYGFGWLFGAATTNDFAGTVIYAGLITAFFGFLIFVEARKIRRFHRDLCGGVKIVFETTVEDFKQCSQRNDYGEVLYSDYFLIAGGEKYQVKADHYFRIDGGDVVRMTVAPASKYAFDVEKIASAAKADRPEMLFHFTSPS